MKKLFAMIIALIMIFSVAGCSGEGKNEQDEITPARGKVESGVYTNEAFGVSFAADENWYFLTDEEIAQSMGIAAEEMFGEGAKITGDFIYDLYCVENATNATVSINHENLGEISEYTDENGYLETVMAQLLSTGAGSGVVDSKISNIKMGEKETPRLYIELEYGGASIYQYVVVKQNGSWMTTVTMAGLSMEDLDATFEKLSF